MTSTESAPEVSAPEVGTPEVVQFLKLLDALVAHQSTTWINKVLQENSEMKAIVKQKEDDDNTFFRAIAKVTNDRDAEAKKSKDAVAESNAAKAKADELVNEIEGAKKTITEKDQKLEEDASTITSLRGNIDALDQTVKNRDDVIKKQEEQQAKDGACIKDLEGALGKTKTELELTTTQLKELQGLSYPVVEESKDFVLSEIDKIYGYAKAVAFKYFISDLPEEVLAETHTFDDIRDLIAPIPLPASNSVPAKKVRVAAFLRSLGSRLADQLFLPFYISYNGSQNPSSVIDPITLLLSNLSESDPKRELHLRSVLLAISPEEQRDVASKRAIAIADEVYTNLVELVLEGEQDNFLRDIRHLCALAAKSWDRLRSLKEKIEPFTVTEEDTEKYWLPAELDGSSVNKKSQPNGLGSKPSLHSLKSAKKVTLVWPGFSYGSEVLKQGFMLLDSQVERAEEEARPSKRGMRAMQRAATGSPLQSPRRSALRKSKVFQRAD
ncbi:hypothetical protein EKO27_g2532 [Xylaria grammica]|uniref:MEI5 protein n=1 Tax=Xylaria grammica TaxID=363999 RepID=A0A439DDS1_9PEZI|nr:hypothetical protein EKO27_g2532 [Xylaria grammica]